MTSNIHNSLMNWWVNLTLENKTDEEIVKDLENKLKELFFFEKEVYIGDYGYSEDYVEGFNHMVELVEEKFENISYPQEEEKNEREITTFKDKNWYVDTKILLKSNWSPTSQTPEETEQSLKDAMRKAIDDGIIPSREELEKEAENDMKLKNLLKAMDEYFDENKPPILKERFEEYLQKGDFAQSHHVIANELVDIVKEFISPSSTTNSYEWERCLKTIRDKLR